MSTKEAITMVLCAVIICATFIGCEWIKNGHQERLLKAGFKQEIGGWR